MPGPGLGGGVEAGAGAGRRRGCWAWCWEEVERSGTRAPGRTLLQPTTAWQPWVGPCENAASPASSSRVLAAYVDTHPFPP